MRRRSLEKFCRAALTTTAALAVGFVPGRARADVTSWLALGGGASMERNRTTTRRDPSGTLTYSIGVGSSPLAPLVLGGLVRGKTMVGFGTDLGLSLRAATGGFARGEWGLALDAGAVWRSWGDGAYGDWPVEGVLTAGSPWGLELSVGADLWSLDRGPSAQGFFATLQVDLLRLTVMRQGPTEHWWPNPNPAGGRAQTALAW